MVQAPLDSAGQEVLQVSSLVVVTACSTSKWFRPPWTPWVRRFFSVEMIHFMTKKTLVVYIIETCCGYSLEAALCEDLNFSQVSIIG